MFETLTCITIATIVFFMWQNQQLGLTAVVPKDPQARANWQAAQCLETFKKQLAGAEVTEIQESRISFVPKNSQENCQFWCEAGQVFLQKGPAKAENLHELGPAGTLAFRLLSGTALFAKIVADSGQGQTHEVGVRLDVTLNGPVFQPG